MKWLHISDIHFDFINDGTATKMLQDNFFSFIEKNNIAVDELFFTGDFRHAKNQKNQDIDIVAKKAITFLIKVADSVGIKETSHIHIVPGNHDLSRDTVRKLNIDEICKHYNGNFYEDDKKQLRNRFSFFEKCVKLLDNNIWSDFQTGPLHRFQEFDFYSIVYLNTAIACGLDYERGDLAIGSAELYEIFKELKKSKRKNTIFILAHHPMEALKFDDMRMIKDMINMLNVPVFWLCGDYHTIMENNTYDIVELATGCFKIESGTQAGFFVGEFMPEYMNVNLKAYVGSSRGKWDYSVSYSELANSAIPLVLRKQEYPSQFTIAEHYALQGNYMEAIKHCIIALNESKLNNRIKANMELKLGFWYCWLDKNNEAIKTLVPLIDTFLILNDKKNLALCYNYIGLVYDEMGKWSSSEFNYIQAMKVYDELKAETTGVFDLRKECFQCFANIGLMYFRWGQSTASSIYFGNAKEYYEKALTFFESNEKALQNDAAIFFNNYALFCDNQKNYEKAIELYNKALYIKSKTLGQWHISSARIYSNLGLVYYNLQCYEKSILNCETAYRIYKEYDELDCRDALRNLGTLASSKAKNGDKEEALNLLYKQEDMRVKLYGEDSTDLAQTYNNIGNVLVSCNSFSKAEIYLKKALEIRNLKMPTHRYTIETMQQLANLYVLIGYYDEALKWYEKIKNLQINILGKDSKETIDTVSQINNLINIVSKIKN